MRNSRRIGLAALAAVLAVSVAAAPASAITKVDRKQNKALKTLKRSKATNKKVNQVAADLGKLAGDVTAAKNGLAAIQAAVPGVTDALTKLGAGTTQLKTGLETLASETTKGFDTVKATLTTLGTGLTQLKAGVETLAAQTQAGFDEVELQTGKFIGGAEYGFAQLYFDPEGNGFEADDAVPGQLVVSSDVPDDTNQSTVTGKLMLRVPDGTTAKPVALKAALRSGEKDGTGAANPAGVAGLMAMSGSMIGAPGTTSIAGGNPGSTALPLTSAPNAGLGGLPVYPIADKAARAGANPFVFPDAQSIELTNPATLQTLTGAPTRFTVTNTSGADAAAIFDITVRFHDLTPADPDNLDE